MNEFTVAAVQAKKRHLASFAIQWEQLWHRTKTFAIREPAIIFVRIAQSTFNGLLAIAIWW